MNFEDFNIGKKDSIYLAVIILFTLSTILIRINTHLNGAIYSPDVSVYLLNALSYANMDYYNIVDSSNIYYSPVISILTAILFKLGINFRLSIYIVTGILCFIGHIGVYVLFKNRFSRILSFTGTVLYGSFSIVAVNLSGGYIDVPAVSISVWIIIFSILAINKNPKYFMVLTPLLVIGFFTRYTVGFTLPVIILYYLMQRNFIALVECLFYDTSQFKRKIRDYLHSDEFKYIALSIIIALALFLLVCGIILLNEGSLTFFKQSQDTLSSNGYNEKGPNYVQNTIFYFKHFRYIIFNEKRDFNAVFAFSAFLLILASILIKMINVLRNLSFINYLKNNKKVFKTSGFKTLLALVFVLSIIGFFYSFRVMKNHLISNILLFIAFLILFEFIDRLNFNRQRNSLNFLFISWFAFYFVFITLYPIKVYRYAIPLLPAFAYFVIWGLDCILDTISNKFDTLDNLKEHWSGFNVNDPSKIIPVIIVILLMASTFAYIVPLETTDVSKDLFAACDYIIEHDDDYHNHTVIAPYRYSSISKFYLQTNTSDVSMDEIPLMNDTYLITNETVNTDNYRLSKQFGEINLYTHV